MAARIFASLLVLGSTAFLLTNCSSDGGSDTPAAGSPSVAGAGNSAGAPAAGAPAGGAPAGGGGNTSIGGAGSAGTPSGGSAGSVGGGGTSAGAGASQGGSGGAHAGAGGQPSGGGSSAGAGGQPSGTFALTSSKLAPGMTFPTAFTCGGDNHSPPFAWTSGPSGTLSYALVLHDPDAPGGTYYHWAVWDIPPATNLLAESFQKTGTITTPAGAKQSGTGYSGPCPPGNAVHTYVFTLYALDVATLPGVTTSTSAANVTTAIQMHDLASATLTAPSNGK